MLAGLFSRRALSVSNFYNKELQNLIDRYLAEGTVDAIYCTSSAMAEYVFSTAHHRSASASLELMDFMDLDSDKWRQYREISNFPMSLIYRYEEMTLARYEEKIQRRFNACIFISSNEVDLFSQRLENKPDNLHVVGNGVDLRAFRPRESSNRALIDDAARPVLKLLFSGVMDYLPNENAVLWFIDNVWDQLRAVRPDAELVVAGMNPSQAIQKLAQRQGITVTGYVEDMLACYHAASIFVAPFQIARGVQNKVLQSFACGLPVVTTSAGAEGIDCEDGVHYALAASPEQFVEQIIQLSENRQRYRKISQNAIQLVQDKYTWSAMNEVLLPLFEQSSSALD